MKNKPSYEELKEENDALKSKLHELQKATDSYRPPLTETTNRLPLSNTHSEANELTAYHLKEKEAEITKREARLRILINTIPDLVWLKDPLGVYLRCNHRFERFFGASESEIVGKTDYDFVPKELADFFRQKDHEAVAANRARSNLEWVTYADDGHKELLETIKTPMYDDKGNCIGILGIARDITERHQAEQAIIAERDFTSLIIDSTPALYVAIDKEGNVIRMNDTMLHALDYTRDEVSGKPYLSMFVLPEEQEKVQKNFDEIVHNKRKIVTENRVLNKYGHELICEWYGTPVIKDDVVEFFIGMGIDISARKQAEMESRKLQAQLFQAQKMEAIGTLAGGIAHDFNNILGGIMGYIELLKTRIAGPDNMTHAYLEGALQGITRASNLVSQMMTFSRQQGARLQPLEMGPLLKEALKLLRSSIPAMVKINYHIAASNDIILADPTQIHQIIMNLCINAAHAMKDKGGMLDIALNHIPKGDDTYSRYNELNTDIEYQELVVRDTGYGIDHHDIDRIFEPFFTTKKREGTGLGLAVVYGIVKSIDGVIKVESRPGQGTTFRVFIPTVTMTISNESDDRNAIPRGSERIMFVDDEQVLTQVFKTQLENIGYKVTTHNDPIEAVKVFKNHPAEFDLLITDFAMPNKKGTELFVEVKQIIPDMPIILCTGNVEVEEIDSFNHIGIQHVITKPVSIHRLATAIRQVLDCSR
jgi:PAS domain S-box-containing protein